MNKPVKSSHVPDIDHLAARPSRVHQDILHELLDSHIHCIYLKKRTKYGKTTVLNCISGQGLPFHSDIILLYLISVSLTCCLCLTQFRNDGLIVRITLCASSFSVILVYLVLVLMHLLLSTIFGVTDRS